MKTIPNLFDRLDSSLEKMMRKKNLDSQDELEKKYMLTQGVFAISGLLLMFVVGWAVSAKLVAEFCLVYIPIMIISSLIFYFVKKPAVGILIFKIVMILVSSVYIVRMGGLLTSGGLFLLTIQAVTSSVVMRNFKRIFLVVSVFVAAMLMLIFLQPFFPAENVLNPKQNFIIFSLNIITVTGFIFFFSVYAVNLFSKMEQRETQRQKELNDAKTRLYTNITHEFRTPLTVILGLADSVKSQSNGTVAPKMDTIIKNGKNLLQLVDQMLDLSKLESGNLTVNKIHGNIIPFLRYVFQLQEFYAVEKQIEMKFQVESQSYELDFDPEKITAIVSNLLSNAIKFTPVGGKIEMTVHENENHIFIEIKDNGIGISPDKQDKIFERFYQADDKNTRKAGGAGIGLALTRELVQILNGSVEVNSNPGIGTVFTVRLPFYSTNKEKISATKLTGGPVVSETGFESEDFNGSQSKGHQHLLIVEDNTDVVGYLKACYNEHFSISVASNGKEGFEKAVQEIPDIIISDVMMPEMDGFELCKKLKNDYRTSHIPIILLTAKADIPSRIEGLEQGADAFIVKPFNQQELLVRMQKLLELRKKLFQPYSNGNETLPSADPVLQKEDEFFRKLKETVQRNLHNEEYNIPELCKDMAMSKSQLYRKFKALTGKSVAKFLRTLRMQKARELLQTTSMNITEVGYEVGMKSLSTFSQVFKEEFGESPREFVGHLKE